MQNAAGVVGRLNAMLPAVFFAAVARLAALMWRSEVLAFRTAETLRITAADKRNARGVSLREGTADNLSGVSFPNCQGQPDDDGPVRSGPTANSIGIRDRGLSRWRRRIRARPALRATGAHRRRRRW